MKDVLIVTIGFSPNVGGIETHFDDLTYSLKKRGWNATVLTYYPLTTNVSAKYHEITDSLEIFRIPILRGFFYKLVNSPAVEFIYLAPGLFLALPVLLLFKGQKFQVIHSHGLIAGFVSVFWGKIFRKKVITTTHSIYNFPEGGFYRSFAKWVFSKSDAVLTLSRQSRNEIINLGIDKNKIKVFTYWIDLNKFKPAKEAKAKLGWRSKFVVLFVGRLVKEKGILELLRAAEIWDKKITLAIAGSGPMEKEVKIYDSRFKNIEYLGRVDNDKLPLYYSAADVVIVPSIHEEGFGRVILESLACGTPVIGSNRGAIPEAMDETVGRLITVNPVTIASTIDNLYKNPQELYRLSVGTRNFAIKNYSRNNLDSILGTYKR